MYINALYRQIAEFLNVVYIISHCIIMFMHSLQ